MDLWGWDQQALPECGTGVAQFPMRAHHIQSYCPAFFLKELTNKVSRMHCRKAAIPHCQSRPEEHRQRRQLACQVICVLWSSSVTNQSQCVPAGSSCLLLHPRSAAKPERMSTEHM